MKKVYKCNLCWNIIELLHEWGWQLVCCGQNIELIWTKNVDVWNEKHLPVIIRENDKVTVKVWDIPHPMEESHYIQWIEVIDGDNTYRKYLNSSEKPEAEFIVSNSKVTAREYCNLHWLWEKSE